MSEADDMTGKYLRDLVRAGCRVTFTPMMKPHRGLEIKGERLRQGDFSEEPEVSQWMVRFVPERDLEETTCGPGLPLALAVRDLARGLAESL